MAVNRELSQFGRLVQITDNVSIGIGTTSNVNIGFGTITATTITATTINGSVSSATTTTNIPNLTGDITSNGTVTSIASGVIVNADINASAAIDVTKLSASTISGITLGNNLNTLTLNTSGTGISGSTTYNGSSPTTFTVTSNATSLNQASTIVSRDASGNFSGGTITATSFSGSGTNLTGIVTSIVAGTNITISGSTGQVTINSTASGGGGTSSQWTTGATGITTTSSVGIKSTTPTSALDVTGDVKVSGIVTATDFNSSSDINLKTNIQTIENPIDKLLEINGVTFNWIENEKASVGVIAQDVERALPQLVNNLGSHKVVNYNGLIGLLVECIKHQQKQIDELKEHMVGP